MTASYEIPQPHGSRASFRSKPVEASKIHTIIPTFNDWDGLRQTVDSLLRLRPSPCKIIVVNDNVFKHEPDWIKEYGRVVEIARPYEGNRGPAYARNIGFGFPETAPKHYSLLGPSRSRDDYVALPRRAWEAHPRLEQVGNPVKEFRWRHEIDWFYFTDCGCEHATTLFSEFELAWKETGDSCVAISGPITGDGAGPINKFMTEQGVLNPPKERMIYDTMVPQAIITANALISGIALSFIGGFDETFKQAAGEDLDLGLRLRRLGMIAWAEKAVVKHRFPEDRGDFVRRFKRYGAGNRALEVKHNLPSLRARKIKAELPELQELADLQVEAMQNGYDAAVEENARGKIFLSEQGADT